MIFDFELTGQMPILFHADDVEAADELKRWREDPDNKKFSVAGDDRSPAWTWITYLYSDGKHLAMPNPNIMVALRTAGAKIIMKKQETFKKVTQSGLFIPSEHCEFRGPNGQVPLAPILKLKVDHPTGFGEHVHAVKDHGFRLFVKRAPVKRGGAKHVRVRARFDEWSVRGRIEVLDSIITADVLQKLFDFAGDYAGLGDWRPSSPSSPGPYGRFSAKLKRAA